MSQAYVPDWLRRLVCEQARNRCGYCLTSAGIGGQPMEIEHLVPVSLGGPTVETNLWLACTPCNRLKGDRIWVPDRQSVTLVRLFNPRRQAWREHFFWSAVADTMVARTAVGRATLEALDLNRQLLVNARRIWIAAGVHPPPE